MWSVHLAAQIDVRKSVADPIFDANTNILGTLNLLEAVRQSGKRTRVVFTSTGGAIYGDFNTPPNVETFQKDPESPYAISKLSAEYYLAYYGRVHGLEHVSLRFGNVYGPRQDPHGEAGVVAIFCNRILRGKSLTVSATEIKRAITCTSATSRAPCSSAQRASCRKPAGRRARIQCRHWGRHVRGRSRAPSPGRLGQQCRNRICAEARG